MANVLPISSTKNLIRNKPYFTSNLSPLLSLNDRLLPFQFRVSNTTTSIQYIYLVNANTDVDVENILTYIDSGDYELYAFTSYKYISYFGQVDFTSAHKLSEGDYYLRIVTNIGSYYSDEFRVCESLFDLTNSARIKATKFSFYNEYDMQDADLMFQTDFSQEVFLHGIIKGSEPRYIEEISEIDGIQIIERVSLQNVYQLRTTVSEHLYNALILLPLHQNITVTDYYGNTMSAENLKVKDVNWLYGGAFCSLTIEFVETSVTFKNTNIDIT